MARRRFTLLRIAPGVIVAAMLGVLVGVGLFTFHYAEGASYFSKDPASCANCHIMNPQYDSWLKSSHESVAGCADCHLPAGFPHSVISKAENGWNHSWGFTFQDFHEPIQLTARNQRTLQDNCVRCHLDMVDQMLGHAAEIDRGDVARCVRCHAGVGHTDLPR